MMNSAPDYFEPLVGWRAWTVRDNRLHAISMMTEWMPYARIQAIHENSIWPFDDDSKPGESCECELCGIYAYRTEAEIRERLLCYGYMGSFVIGRVSLWGRVAIHAHGYRAQYAYPLELLYAEGCDGSAVAKTYGIPYNEDLSWKSDVPNESSSWNHWWYQSPPVMWSGLSRIGFPFTNPNQWSSRYLLRPDDHRMIIRPETKDPLDLELPGLPVRMIPPKIDLAKRYQMASGVWVHRDRIAEPEDDDYFWVPIHGPVINGTPPEVTTKTGLTFTPRYSSVIVSVDWAE